MASITPGNFTVSGQTRKALRNSLEKKIAIEMSKLDFAIKSLDRKMHQLSANAKYLEGLKESMARNRKRYIAELTKLKKIASGIERIKYTKEELYKIVQEIKKIEATVKGYSKEIIIISNKANKMIERREQLKNEVSEGKKNITRTVSFLSKLDKLLRAFNITEYINYARLVLQQLEKEEVAEFRANVLDALPTIQPQIVGYNVEQFNKILRQYIRNTRLSVSEAINKKALNVAIKALKNPRVKRSLKPTQRAMDALTHAENMRPLPDWRKDRKGGSITTLRAIRIYWLRKKGLIGENERYRKEKHGKLQPGNYRGSGYVPESEEDARLESKRKINRARASRLGWYKIGFLEIAGILAPHVPGDKFRYNKRRGVGHAEPARPGVQPVAVLYHKAPWARRAASQAFSEALAEEAKDMERYIKRKLKNDVFAREPVVRIESASALTRKGKD